MPVYLYECACGFKAEKLSRASQEHECPECQAALRRLPNLIARAYIPERDKAVNAGGNSRYREWVKSPQVQAQIKAGKLVREGRNSNPLSDDLASF